MNALEAFAIIIVSYIVGYIPSILVYAEMHIQIWGFLPTILIHLMYIPTGILVMVILYVCSVADME